MPFSIYAWGASLLFGLVGIVGKLTSKHQIANPWLFNFFWHLFIVALTIPIAVANRAALPTSWEAILPAAFFYALASIGYVLALQNLDVSVMMPLFNLRVVVSAILGALFLQEFYQFNEYLIMLVIVFAGFLVALDERFSIRSFFQKGIVVMFFEIIALSLMYIYMNKSVNTFGLWTATLWVQLIGQLMFLVTIPLFYKEVRTLKKAHVVSLFAMALFGTLGFLGENKAVASNVTITTIIVSFPISMVIAFLFSRFAPQLLEKHTLKVYAVRFAAAAVMIGATLYLTL